MKRSDEEQCKAAFHRFLCARYPESAIAWEDGPDPPDFTLRLAHDTFAVEVTTLMESHDLGDGFLPLAAVRASLQRFVEIVERDARQAGMLRGSYLVVATKPIQNFASSAQELRNHLLQYISDTQNQDNAPEVTVFRHGRERLTIQKCGDGSDKVAFGGPFFGKWEGEAAADARILFDRILDGKRQKLRNVADPVILIVRDAYLFADVALLKNALVGLESLTAFHTVFVVSGATGVALYSENDTWLK